MIFSDTTALLVDAGISYTRLCRELRDFGLTPDNLDGVVLTHEHSDHIVGLQRLQEHTGVYAHPLTARAVYEKQGKLKNYREEEYYENGFNIGDIKVLPFRIPHDAAYPLAYSFECGELRVSVATDIGQPTVGVVRNLSKSRAVLLEANHDLDMLKTGKYPYNLKQRILGVNGHLSNDAAALIVMRLSGTEVKRVMLGHISENNNLPELAYTTVRKAIDSAEDNEMELYLAKQNIRSEVFEIK